jgi:BirA family biotin operon repressor/biotin-[acetyl-CoA-carboxylase] ligase
MLGEQELARWEGHSPTHWARAWGIAELHILGRTGSTNDVAKRLAEQGAPAGTAVITEEQTAGRGRLGRRWLAPSGRALLISVVLRPPVARRSIRLPTTIPIRVGLATARAIEAVAAVTARLKWPNDVVIPGAGKVAGILCEGALGDNTDEFVIAGVGVNVNQQTEQLPEETRAHASSLAIITGAEISRARLAGALLRELAVFAHSAGEPLDSRTLADYAARDLLAGEQILVDDVPVGTAAGITSDGALAVTTSEGRRVIRGGTIRLAQNPTATAHHTTTGYPLGAAIARTDSPRGQVP